MRSLFRLSTIAAVLSAATAFANLPDLPFKVNPPKGWGMATSKEGLFWKSPDGQKRLGMSDERSFQRAYCEGTKQQKILQLTICGRADGPAAMAYMFPYRGMSAAIVWYASSLAGLKDLVQ